VRVLVTGRADTDTIAISMLPRSGGALVLSFGGGTVSGRVAESWRSTADSLSTDGRDWAFTAELATTWLRGMRREDMASSAAQRYALRPSEWHAARTFHPRGSE